MQKFAPEPGEAAFPKLSDRRNIVVLVDEAHRTQYGFDARVNAKGEVVYGNTPTHLRQRCRRRPSWASPARLSRWARATRWRSLARSLTATTSPPAIEDGATVPIYYEARVAKLALDEATQRKLDADYAEITEDTEESEAEAAKRRWSRMEALVGADKRLDRLAETCWHISTSGSWRRTARRCRVHEPAHLRGPLCPHREAAARLGDG